MPGRAYCCVVGCHSYSKKNVDGRIVSLHRFPSGNSTVNRKLRSIWLSRISRKNFSIKSWTRVCSEHFEGKRGPTTEVNLPSIFKHRIFKTFKLKDMDILSPESAAMEIPTQHEVDVDKPEDSVLISPPSLSRLDVSVLMHDYNGKVEVNTLPNFKHQAVGVCPKLVDVSTQTDIDYTNHVETLFHRSTGTQTCETTQSYFDTVPSYDSVRPWLTVDDLSEAEMMFYTGLPDKSTFSVLFDEITENDSTNNIGRPHKLSLKDEFFMVLMRLRLGLLVLDLAKRFGVSSSTVSSIFNLWIDKMYQGLHYLVYWPSQDTVRHNMPEAFKSRYPTTRVIIDCTELYTETPKSLINKSLMYSDYKSHMTWKVLVGISPSGVITYVSNLWGGNTSDKQITERSGFLDGLDSGDAVMADKGFQIADLLIPRNVHLIIPPKKKKFCKFTAKEVESTRRIANLRIHVERAMERIKNFRILQGVIPLSMSDQVSKIFFICSALSNLQSPLVKH